MPRQDEVGAQALVEFGGRYIIPDSVAVLIDIIPSETVIALLLIPGRQDMQSIDLELDRDRIARVTRQRMQR